MRITKALIVADPWIGYLLDGTKTWEMRSTGASHRGWFGLIRKGTGAVHGVARLVGVGAPLSPAEMIETFDRHRIPAEMIRSGEVAKWNVPWKLADVRRLPTPVPYRHKSGAVTWVDLDPAVSGAIERQLLADSPVSSLRAEGEAIQTPPPDDADPGRHCEEAKPTRQSSRLPPAPVAPGSPRSLRSLAMTAPSGRFIGEVELTEGNIRNNHIYLRGFFDRFPEDAVGGSNRHEKAPRELTVDWGGGSPVQTDLDGSKRFFRARGWIRSFFDMNEAAPGDRVVVEEIAPYCYRVSLRK